MSHYVCVRRSGVTPQVYYTFAALYGVAKESPAICRYKCDIYSAEVSEKDLLHFKYVTQKKASAQVSQLRMKWLKPPHDDDEDEVCLS